MKGKNLVILIGNVGNPPEIRYTAGGDAVANFSIATSEQWKDKQGEKQEKTEWHRCVAFRKLAEIIGEYVGKGSKLYVEGKLQTRKWQDKEGKDNYTTEIVVNEMQMLDSKSDAAPQSNLAQAASHGHAVAQQPDDFDDSDIPF